MTISVDYITNIITIEKADMTLVTLSPYEIRSLDLNTVHNALRTGEADEAGTIYPRTHDHNTEVTLGGVTYARQVEFLAPYTITLEDGAYACDLTGANNNLVDRINLNQVQVRTNNSAGLQTVTSGSGVLPQDIIDIAHTSKDAIFDEIMETGFDFRDFQLIMASALGGKASGMDTTSGIFRSVADAKNRISVTMDEHGNRAAITFDLT
ncbi:MAG: hypothetical protein GY815_07560 [Gammaproteobacteria bacterium]|nr:hypothetical protein [Gammaproteobacteria bacterium]